MKLNKIRVFEVVALVWVFLITVAPAQVQPPPSEQPVDAFEQNRRLGRGVNILGYDPLWRARDQSRFQMKHFALLKQAGFNSVRINLHPFQWMNETNKWRLADAWTQSLNWAFVNAYKQKLVMVFDLHEYEAMGKDPAANQQRFLSFWRQISARYHSLPSNVLFEILNEPFGKMTPELWNSYLRDALALIREKNPTRTVIIGPAYWNSIDHLQELDLPKDDPNIIVTVHYYEPMDFTHQGAAWANRQDKLGVDWKGTKEELDAINRKFDKADAWAKEHHRPIFLGEFGAYDKAPMEARARWTAAVARAAEARGWSWAYWQFDSDFILYDIEHDSWVQPIRDALIPPVKAPAR